MSLQDEYKGISEEMLSAFSEGNTTADETRRVLQALCDSDDLLEEYMLSKRLDAMMATYDDADDMDILPMQQMAAESHGNLCDLQCEAYILQRRGQVVDMQLLAGEAKHNRWLRERGTPLHSIGRLLEQRNLIVLRRYGADSDDIARALNAGHDVIVVLNSNKLVGNSNMDAVAYHAVVVLELTECEVLIFDPADGNEVKRCCTKMFAEAWKDAKEYMVRVKGRDYDYNPMPIDLDDVDLDLELIDLCEAIAENAHEVWADQRQEEGWTYGPERNDQKKQHPDMLPYAMLPEQEKEYDRRMAFDTIKLMKKLGYDIVKRADSEAYRQTMQRLKNINGVRQCQCGANIYPDQIYCSHCGKRLDWKEFL